MNNKIYYLCGPDGSGKTSYIEEIERKLISQDLVTRHIWIRSPKIFSKPLMAYCRLVGLTKYKIIDGVKYGKHEFYRSKFVSYLFPILQLIDFKIKWLMEQKKIRKDEIILFDRFSLDTLVDLMVDTNRMDLHASRIGRAFIRLLPQNTFTMFMNVDEQIIRQRKKDTLYDEHLDVKIKAYKILATSLNLQLIDNNRPFDIVKDEILNKVEL